MSSSILSSSSWLKRRKIAVVCSSNQNRSMAAHVALQEAGFHVSSFGTGDMVRLPGARADEPNVFLFGTPYTTMYETLLQKDHKLYTHNGILPMLERNARVKLAPERFQESTDHFTLIFCFEERVLDAVIADLHGRESGENLPVHVVNLTVKDSRVEAEKAAKACVEFCEMASQAEDLDEQIEEVIRKFEEKYHVPVLHTVAYY